MTKNIYKGFFDFLKCWLKKLYKQSKPIASISYSLFMKHTLFIVLIRYFSNTPAGRWLFKIHNERK